MRRSTAVLLACAALDPGMSTLLLVDDVVDADELSACVERLATWLHAVGGVEPRIVRLAGSPSESRLWGELGPLADTQTRQLRVGWVPGVLTRQPESPAIVLVPDLG